jgi:transcriptional regulator with XRE-family HTH domain
MLKRWIALELRRLREAAGLSRLEVAERLGRGVSHVGHIETMRNLPSPTEVEAFLNYCGVGERTQFFLELLTRAKKSRDWWTEFSNVVPSWFDLYMGMESSAVKMESYDALMIPGLAQTPEYTEAIIRGDERGFSDAEVTKRVELRMARQKILDRNEALRLWMVLDESALRRMIGGPALMQKQLCHLIKLAEHPRIDLQALLTSTGAHPALYGSFTIMSFPAEFGKDPGVVYTQTRIQGIYYEESTEIDQYRLCMNRLGTQAAPLEDTPSIITRIARELTG